LCDNELSDESLSTNDSVSTVDSEIVDFAPIDDSEKVDDSAPADDSEKVDDSVPADDS
jgi:hypothetical protein